MKSLQEIVDNQSQPTNEKLMLVRIGSKILIGTIEIAILYAIQTLLEKRLKDIKQVNDDLKTEESKKVVDDAIDNIQKDRPLDKDIIYHLAKIVNWFADNYHNKIKFSTVDLKNFVIKLLLSIIKED